MNALRPNLLLGVLLLFAAGHSTYELRANGTAGDAASVAFAEANKLRAEQFEASSRKAVEKFRQAALLFEVHGEPKRASIALRNAGEILQLLGDTSDALACYQQALVLTNKTNDSLERGRILNDIAFHYFARGNTKEARLNALKALQVGTRLRNREIEAAALSNLGEAFYGTGEIDKARQHQERALKIWRELNDPRGQAIASVAIGYCHSTLGEPEKALRSFTDALSLARHAGDDAVETTAMLALCNIKRRSGNNQEALESYVEAKSIADRTGDQMSRVTTLGGMGAIHLRMGNARQALEYLSEATQIMERNGNDWGTAECKLEMGKTQYTLGDEQDALRTLGEALALSRSLGMPRMESAALRELGLVYESLGDTTKALESHLSALRITKTDQDQREESYTLNYIGRIYEKLKQPDRALQYYARAQQLSQRSKDPLAQSLIGYNLAHLERDRGNLAEARRQIEATLKIIESQRTNVSSQDLRTSYFATMRNAYELYINVLMMLHNQNPQLRLDKEAFAVSEMARARSFHELLLEARMDVRHGVDPALLAKEKQVNESLNAKAQHHVQLLAAKQNDEAAEVSKQVDALVSELTRLRDQIRQDSRQRNTLELPQLLSLNEVQQRVLDDDTILAEYVLGDDRSYVWVLTKTTAFSFDLAPRAEIEASVARLHKLITAAQAIHGEPISVRRDREERAAAEIPAETALLSRLLLGPLAGKLNKQKLRVVPDGALQVIPFAWLTNPDTGDPLIVTHEISYSSSASTLAFLQAEAGKRQPKINSVAVLADPVFEADDPRLKSSSESTTEHVEIRQALRDVGISPDGVEIPRLFASGAEANGIISVAPWRTSLKAVGFAANRERVLGPELADYRIVHFATHGIVNNQRPELSGIVLSLFDREGRSQNGFLRLHDIYNLHLPADLVVLSACSTGLGKDVRGEGVIGLARGFMYAGASGVIASLWKVDDDATAELMKHFYAGLFKRNLSPAAALREAQLTVARNKRWQSPYYWAGFVLQGQYTQTEKFREPFPGRFHVALFAALSGVILVGAPILLSRRRRRRDI